MTEVAIVYHSGYGHTEVQARHVAKGAEQVENINVRLLKVEEIDDVSTLNSADAIIFGAPTYMGSASAPFKQFMDDTSKAWFNKDWKDKLAAGFTNSHSLSGDKFNTLIQFVTLAAQHGMMWVSLGVENESADDGKTSGDPQLINRIGSYLGAMAQSENDAPNVTPPEGDKKTAELLGKRVATLAVKWKKVNE